MPEYLPPLPGCDHCLGCGADNPEGLRMRFTFQDGQAEAEVLPPEHLQGFEGYLHGGAIAAILDEVQGRTAWAAGLRTVTAELNIRYLLPVPMGQRLTAIGRVIEPGERRYRTEGELRLADGRIAASATGIFAVPRTGTFGA